MKFLLMCSLAYCKQYILTPKIHATDLHSFNEEHNVEHLAQFDGLVLYKTNQDNFQKYKNTLLRFYEVEEEQTYTATVLKTSESDLPWHLGRIVTEDLPLNTTFDYGPGTCHKNKDINIHSYVVDTGIDVDHPEFEGRATFLANFVDDQDTDCQNHGTHCSGLIGSRTYGVCKDAVLFAVKVLNCEGSGSTSSVIAGIEYAFKRHRAQDKESGGKTRSIVSMSLGGGFSSALNRAVQATLVDPHFYFAAASGNESQDSCRTSPASVKEIFTVMASGIEDRRAYFSNFGECSDIYSPGVDIRSTIPNSGTAVYSGSSMACPILVGVLNHYIDQFPELNMKQLKEKVLSDSTKDHISGNPKNTNNMLVHLNRVE